LLDKGNWKFACQLQEEEAVEVLRSMWERQVTTESMKQAEKHRCKLEYGAALRDQIICAERLKQVAYEDFLQEKKILDDVVRRIHDEDQRYSKSRSRSFLL
jgi:hypothetical protein